MKRPNYSGGWIFLKTNRPQVIGNNAALYRDAYYQVGGGRDARFLENDRKITELAWAKDMRKRSLRV